MRIFPKTKHNGYTGHHYVVNATVATSGAGLGEVFYDDSTLLELTDDNNLVLLSGCDKPVVLTISARDVRKMRDMLAARENCHTK